MTNVSMRDTGFVCIPDDLATIIVSGEDAESFLQGQLTNDVSALADKYQMNAWCNPRGRVIALLYLWRVESQIFIQMPRQLANAVIARMGMYILRSKVELDDQSEHYVNTGLTGQLALEWLSAEMGSLPEPGRVVLRNGISVRRPDSPSSRYILGAPVVELEKLLASLPQDIPLVTGEAWTRVDIEEGIPNIWSGTSEEFIPQSLNLDILGAVNFRKGCYTGQEIVARTHYLGKPKQRMYLAEAEPATDKQVTPGDPLYASGDDSQTIGRVVSSFNDAGHAELLVSVKTRILTDGIRSVSLPGERRVILTDPPYDMKSEVPESG